MFDYYFEGVESMNSLNCFFMSTLMAVSVFLLIIWWLKRVVYCRSRRKLTWGDLRVACFFACLAFLVTDWLIGFDFLMIRSPNSDIASLSRGHISQINQSVVFGWRIDQRAVEYPVNREVKFPAVLNCGLAKPTLVQVTIQYGWQNSVDDVEKWFQFFFKTRADDQIIIAWKVTEFLAEIGQECPCSEPEAACNLLEDKLAVFANHYGLTIKSVKVQSLEVVRVFYR